MKRNFLAGIVVAGVAVMSSCSAPNQLTRAKAALNDDVYYSKAYSGDQVNYYAQANNENYQADDDYYYYGDYASRLSRFAGYSPFDYSDDFYYSYVPYNNGFGDGLSYSPDYYSYGHANNLTANVGSPYIYSPYDYGYSPFYGGYDDFGYGDLYAAYLFDGGGGYGYGGGSSWHHHTTSTNPATTIGYNPNVRGVRTTPSPGVTRIAAYYPGNPILNINRSITTGRNLTTVNGDNQVNRQTRTDVYRPVQQNNTPPPTYNNTSSGSTSSGSNNSGGGGGRPVRP